MTPTPYHLLYVLVAGGLILGANAVGGEAVAGITALVTVASGLFLNKVNQTVKTAEAVSAKVEEVKAETEGQTATLSNIAHAVNGKMDAKFRVVNTRVQMLEIIAHRNAEAIDALSAKVDAFHALLEERLPPRDGA